MTLFFNAGGLDLGVSVRAGTGFSLTMSADNGTVAMSTLQVDDPTGVANLVTLTAVHVDETAATPQRAFAGFLADVKVLRADSLLTGAARRWDCSVSDLNYVWQQKVLRSADANRPAETDVARVTWLLGSTDFGAILADHGLVSSTGPVNLGATDYRGRFPSDVMSDCAQASNKNWFAYTDATTNDTSLFYDLPSSSAYTSTLRISNVLTDVDGTTTFAPLSADALERDGSRKASGIDLTWASGTTYVQNTGLGFTRDLAVTNLGIKTSAVAATTAATLLAKAADFDKITCSVQLPPASLTLIRAGQRISVKFSHLPGYSSFTYLRITRITVAQAGATDDLYTVLLELSNPFVLGGITTAPITNPTPPVTAPPPATTNTIVDGSCAVSVSALTTIGTPPAFELIDIATGYGLADSSGLGTNGCDIAATRWYAGPVTQAGYYAITVTCIGTGALVLRVTISAPLAGPIDLGFYAYLCATVPVSLDQGQLLGVFYGGTATVDIPASWFSASSTMYLLLSPVGRTVGGPVCLGNFTTPVKSGTNNAYGYRPVGVSAAHWMALDAGQTAMADWLPVEEAANGSRVTFTLDGWDGTTTPQVLVNGLAANVTSTDTTAGTVTVATAPFAGALVTARYPVKT